MSWIADDLVALGCKARGELELADELNKQRPKGPLETTKPKKEG